MTAILEPPATTRDEPPRTVRPTPVDTVDVPPLPPALPAPAEAPAPREPRVRRVLTPAGVRAVGAAMFVLFWIALELEPPADGPLPTITGWDAVLVNVQTFALFATVAGVALGRRWALWAALAFSSVGAVNIAICPASGHHLIGGWWYGQVAAGAAMLLLPALVLARTRRGSR